ncbi:MAG: hypothetical protein NTV07_04745, partial [Candidatus Omnitrophica bacterium]|nr:hypothetical protein [Candidatus Omnitrophota bacterium]
IGNVYVYQMLYTRDPNYRFLPYAPDVPLTAHPLDKGWYIYHVAVSSNPHPVHSPSDDLLVKDGW